jgi:DNA repair protein RecN (Recombination protein N)
MLQQLLIRNYAIIEDLEVSFHSGLSIITGETGAGKSILMGALGLVLGDRADTSVLLSASEKCMVEAVFDYKGQPELAGKLREWEIDEDDKLLFRREISPNGKSRSFINDTPVNLQALRSAAGLLVDLHRQFDTLDLSENLFQLGVLDALAGQNDKISAYGRLFVEYAGWQKRLAEAEAEKQQAGRELDYHLFLHQELEDAAFGENEIEEAETELALLASASEVKATIQAALDAMAGGDEPLIGALRQTIGHLTQLKARPAGLDGATERLKAVQVELKDICSDLSHMADALVMDDERLHYLNERMNLGNKLLKKHGLTTTADLLALKKELSDKIAAVRNTDEEIENIRIQLKQREPELVQQANAISAARKKAASVLEKGVNALLAQMGMPSARLTVGITHISAPGAQGVDAVSFLFDANNTGRFEPIEKVASGGELSRLMLGIKSLVASTMHLPTLIFDEIDTGISGEAARQVGIIMQRLAQKHQVITITHQPQIAARAKGHYFVYKQNVKGKLRTAIRLLDGEERIHTIARMLGGDSITEASTRAARELIER